MILTVLFRVGCFSPCCTFPNWGLIPLVWLIALVIIKLQSSYSTCYIFYYFVVLIAFTDLILVVAPGGSFPGGRGLVPLPSLV